VAIIDFGKFVALDTPPKLKDILGGDVVSLELQGEADGLLGQFQTLDWIKTVKSHDDVVSLTMERGERRIPELVNEAQKFGLAVTCVHLRKPSLEDVFLHFTGRTIRDQEAGQGERQRERMRGHGRR
jgi:ABC-2 type transport system ATP-binding protein